MRVAAVALSIAFTICACRQRPAPPTEARPVDVEIGSIQATAKQISEDTVSVSLRWAFNMHTTAVPVTELPPVYLSNGTEMLWAVPSPSPELDDDQVRFSAKVDVSKEAWDKGCWQASHYIEHVIASGPISCINQVP